MSVQNSPLCVCVCAYVRVQAHVGVWWAGEGGNLHMQILDDF